MDFHLSKEHLLVRKMYREFAETKVAEDLWRQEHIFHEFLHLGIIGRDPLAGLAQHVRTINYYRINHLLNSI